MKLSQRTINNQINLQPNSVALLETDRPNRSRVTYLTFLIATAVIYFAAAKLGLSLAFLHISVSPVWPPTGIAIAAVLWLGYRISPAILIGAFFANLATGESIGTAIGISTGNTLEAVTAALLVRRFVGTHNPFYRARDVLMFVLLAVIVSPTVSATIGNASLCLGGTALWSNYGSLWTTWWIGDGVGALVVAPLVLTWIKQPPQPWSRRKLIETTLLLALLGITSTVAFREALPSTFANLAAARLIIPFLLWAAISLGPRGVAASIAFYAGIAVWGTRLGLGPIAGQNPNEALLLLQVSIAANGITFLVLAGARAERKTAEQAITFLASIVESTEDAVIGTTLDGIILSWNKGAEALYGYTAEEVVGRSVSLLMPAERSDESMRIREHLKRGERVEHYETERLTKTGEMIFVALTVSPIKDSDGTIIGASAIEGDITKRKEAERRLTGNLSISKILAESPAFGEGMTRVLRTICESWGWQLGGMWTFDSEAGALRCRQMWRTPSATASEFESISYSMTFAPGVGVPGRVWSSGRAVWIPDVTSDANFPRAPYAVAEDLHAALAFPIISGEKCLGVLEFFSSEIREPNDGLIAMMAGVGSQIGQFMEQKRAEDALRQNEEQLRLALEAANMGAWDYDIGTQTMKWSRSMVAIHGLPPESYGGTLESYLGDIHNDDRDAVRNSLLRCFEKRIQYHDIQYRVALPNGAIRWVEGKGEVTCDGNGNPIRVTGVCMDISHRKNAEQERELLFNREQEARSDAEQANKAKDEFLALVSHELRTPLNSISGWVDILISNPDQHETQLARALDVIKRNVGLQTRIIEDILDVSRIVTGKLTLDKRPLQLPATIQAAINAAQPAAAEKRIRLKQNLDRTTDPVSGDANRLQQVIWNLLSNAIKFSPRESDVEIKLEQIGSNARVTISDEGEGIGADFLPKIFDRFSQANTSSTRTHGGLGLGLAIVKHLVELHGGTVEAQSGGKDKGSSFTVTLPCERVVPALAVQPSAAERRRESDPLAGLRVLVVDDDFDSREVLAALLAMRAAEVRSAGSVREALATLAEWKPHVLVSDIGMPGEDGYDLIRQVRSKKEHEGGTIPAIALTGYTAAQDGERAITAGFQKHLAKPVEPSNLIRLIATYGEEYRRVS
jgi:PAS domain S-box-containing protein